MCLFSLLLSYFSSYCFLSAPMNENGDSGHTCEYQGCQGTLSCQAKPHKTITASAKTIQFPTRRWTWRSLHRRQCLGSAMLSPCTRTAAVQSSTEFPSVNCLKKKSRNAVMGVELSAQTSPSIL
ncbi:hypothetical protein B0J13DRAFT_38472 [Dactylonectria estremocensis]|uniref:Secreted protein n=1 Tax=Dactylonectria estremocensis TaxID=1079267 RepID=A0A9P9FJT9_9HYPO|nr:hypothetical protein B0J13DRAFT_38472 [Dactylonectria estremocensis]